MPRPIAREHILQRQVRLFVASAVTARHEFLAFDRGKASGQFTHMREKGRGIRQGTPDVLLAVQGLPPIWTELKAPGNKPNEAQLALGKLLTEVGHWWGWAASVAEYAEILRAAGVPLATNVEFLILHHQGVADSVVARAEEKRGATPKSYKPRPVKASAGAVRRVSKLRSSVMF